MRPSDFRELVHGIAAQCGLPGGAVEQRLARRYSFSDRRRYTWPDDYTWPGDYTWPDLDPTS